MKVSDNLVDSNADYQYDIGVQSLQVNHLGHWLLTNRIVFDHFKRKREQDLRVVLVTSMAHISGKIDFEDIHVSHEIYLHSL